MNTIEVTSIIFKGKSFEYNKGEIIFYKPSTYSENLQSWTIQLYKLVDNNYKAFERLTQRDFSNEVLRMQELKNIVK